MTTIKVFVSVDEPTNSHKRTDLKNKTEQNKRQSFRKFVGKNAKQDATFSYVLPHGFPSEKGTAGGLVVLKR